MSRCTQEQVGEHRRPLTQERHNEILEVNEKMAGEALRTLGVSLRLLSRDSFTREEYDERIEQDLVFLGLIGMIDPPRSEAREAVARAKRAGIRALMITGDHPVTAAVIASELGIANNARAITGAKLARMSEDQLTEVVQTARRLRAREP